jgi:hypothetical protein
VLLPGLLSEEVYYGSALSVFTNYKIDLGSYLSVPMSMPQLVLTVGVFFIFIFQQYRGPQLVLNSEG